jgi:hypothetical protein
MTRTNVLHKDDLEREGVVPVVAVMHTRTMRAAVFGHMAMRRLVFGAESEKSDQRLQQAGTPPGYRVDGSGWDSRTRRCNSGGCSSGSAGSAIGAGRTAEGYMHVGPRSREGTGIGNRPILRCVMQHG